MIAGFLKTRPHILGRRSHLGRSQWPATFRDHLLWIDPVLNDEVDEQKFPPFVVKPDGVEGVSLLYPCNVTMLRNAGDIEGERENGQKRPPLDVTKLIGAHAENGARPSNAAEIRPCKSFLGVQAIYGYW
jgi:hypothetical protein